ncbi:MAG: ABC transporter permease [Verrucomicrobiaceae bacterium]|nr:MAG: ABC transporter permease [Verrucomicrobiaceae bacterium]
MKHRYFREWSVAAAVVIVLALLAVQAPAFFKANQLLSTFVEAAPILLLACGMALVIICRQIDISVGSQFAVCGVVAGLLAQKGTSMPVVALATLGTGAAFGAFNGILVAWLRLPSIVVTLATMVTWRELLRWWREGEYVRDLPPSFQWFGLNQTSGQIALLVAALVLFLVLTLALKHLSWGRFVYAVGSDAEAARLAGINPQWEKAIQGGIILFAVAADGWRQRKNAH